MNTILVYVIVSALVGFAFSTYIFKETSRKSLEHKSMIFLDLIFVSSGVYGAFSLYLGFDVVFPKGLVLAILTPLNMYVGVVAVHHRNERINKIARSERKKEEVKKRSAHVGNS